MNRFTRTTAGLLAAAALLGGAGGAAGAADAVTAIAPGVTGHDHVIVQADGPGPGEDTDAFDWE